MSRFLVLSAAGLSLLGAVPARAECRFPFMNLGSIIGTDNAPSQFGRVKAGIIDLGSAARRSGSITGCPANARYRLRTDSAIAIRVTNGHQAVALIPLLVAINGVTLPTPVDLTRDNNVILTGNPDVEVVFALSGPDESLATGTYSGGYAMQFLDP